MIDEIRRVLRYEPETGRFYWRESRKGGVRAGDMAGTAQGSGYWLVGFAGKQYLAHRLAWFFVKGEWPAGQVDHKNGDRRDNRFENLRLATQTQQNANTKLRSDNKTGFRGVKYSGRAGRRKRYSAAICVNGKSRSLGYYATPEEAAEAYHIAAEKAFGEYLRVA